MAEHTAKLTLTAAKSIVDVDGMDLASVAHAVQVTGEAGEPPRLVLDFPLHEIEVEGVMRVAVTEQVAKALIALGWSPPQPST